MLLDGHPELNAFPFEHWNRSSKGTFPARKVAEFAAMSSDDRLATAGAPLVEKKLRKLHPDPVVSNVMSHWRADSERATTLPAMYESLARRYFCALGEDPGRAPVNHCGSVCRLSRDELDAVFGKGIHVLTVRDPRAVFASMEALRHHKYTVKGIRKRHVAVPEVERHISKMEVVDGASTYLREFCDDYRQMTARYALHPDVVCLRFEDLVTSTETAMRQFCDRVQLPWNASLLEPTALGQGRAPNSSYARQGSGVHANAAGDWVNRIDSEIRRHIEDALAPEMSALGYARVA